MKVDDSTAVQTHHHCIEKLLQVDTELQELRQIIHEISIHYIFACMDTSAYNAF